MAIKKLVETTGIKVICHDHDFSWERGERYKTPYPEINKNVNFQGFLSTITERDFNNEDDR